MKDDRGLDTADLDRHITGNWGEDSVPREPLISLETQATFTILRLRNLADEMDKNSRDIPERYIQAIREHADDLERAIR